MKFGPSPPEKVIKAFSKVGFEAVRRKGSHVILKHKDGRSAVVPFHKGEEISSVFIKRITKEANLSEEELGIFLEEL